MPPLHRIPIAMAILVILLTAGCTTRGEATPTPAATSSASAVSTPATPTPQIAPPIALSGDACQDWPAVHQRAIVIFSGTQSQLQRGFPQFIDDLTKFQQTVPEAQRADVDQFVNAWKSVRQALDAIDYDLVKSATDPPTVAAFAKTGDAAMVQIMDRLDAWSQGCRGGRPTPTP